MAEKKSEKKFFVLLVVLVVLSLGVNLLSLNVLYTLGKASNLGGEFANIIRETSSDESGCSVVTTSGFSSASCEDNCAMSWNNCFFSACESRYSCNKDCEDGCDGGTSLCDDEYDSSADSCSSDMSSCLENC